MSLTIELTPDQEAWVRDEAYRKGQEVDTFARERLLVGWEDKPSDRDSLIAFLQANANAATQAAREKLHAQGIGYVVAQDDGAVVERLPDGSINVLHAAETV